MNAGVILSLLPEIHEFNLHKKLRKALNETASQMNGLNIHVQRLSSEDTRLMAWRSGDAVCRINKVALRRARLVLGWVTVHGQLNHLGAKPAS